LSPLRGWGHSPGGDFGFIGGWGWGSFASGELLVPEFAIVGGGSVGEGQGFVVRG
jgi:hypothetical protein